MVKNEESALKWAEMVIRSTNIFLVRLAIHLII